MAKKADNKKLFFLIALALGVVALVLYLVPMLKFRVDVDMEGLSRFLKKDGIVGINLG